MQMVILSLIVKRTRIKALVKDKRNAMESFGTYVEVGGRITYNAESLFLCIIYVYLLRNPFLH